MRKSVAVLAALVALFPAAVPGRAATGWIHVHVTGVPEHDHARIAVLYQNSKGDYRHAEHIAGEGSTASFPLGTGARNVRISASLERGNKTVHLQYATLPEDVTVDFRH